MYCFTKFCRLCICADNKLITLFSVDEDMQMFSEKLRCLIPEIIFEEDAIPNLVCHDCCKSIQELFEFKRKCLRNHELLKQCAANLLKLNKRRGPRLADTKIEVSPSELEHGYSRLLVKQEVETDCDSEKSVCLGADKLDQVEVVKHEPDTSTSMSMSMSMSTSRPNVKFEIFKRINEKFKDYELSATQRGVRGQPDIHKINGVLDLKVKTVKCRDEPLFKVECVDDNDYESDEPVSMDCDVSFLESTTEEDHTAKPINLATNNDESNDCEETISINDSEIDEENTGQLVALVTKKTAQSNCGAKDQPDLVHPTALLYQKYGSGNKGRTRTGDKYRMVYTEHQRLELEKEYLLNRFVSDRRRAELSIILGLSVRQIKIWFQNRRAKERKEAKRSEGSASAKENGAGAGVGAGAGAGTGTGAPPAPPPPPPPDKPPKKVADAPVKPAAKPAPKAGGDAPQELRKPQEFLVEQQLLKQQHELLLQEHILHKHKEFLSHQQDILQKEFHNQFFSQQQELIRQEELLRHKRQVFEQQKKLLGPQRQLLLSQSLLPAPMVMVGQPALLSTLLPGAFKQLVAQDLSHGGDAPASAPDPDLLPNLDELLKRKEELLKRNHALFNNTKYDLPQPKK